ncbi:hypothetical protein DRJ23_04140 [Candidatus Acetothermia bacterium]|nr:MAG: hypothetical protein DRJ23_04140 [Candidatus Acetothermia bacterium]
MENRKVQVTGGGTYFVTLPKRWANRVGMQRGAEVTLVENSTGSLLLVPEGIDARNRVVLSLSGKDRVWIERAIISCYITGFDVIEVNGSRITSDQRRAVRETAQALVGLEIMEEQQDRIILHCLVSMRDFAAEATLKRIYSITTAMLHDAVHAFTAHDSELARDVIERDTEADRLTLVMSRELGLLLRDLLLERDVGMSRLLFHEYHAVAKTLERIGDHAVKVSRAALDLSSPLDAGMIAEIEVLYSAAQEVIEGSVEAFLGADVTRANSVLAAREDTPALEEKARLSRGTVQLQPLATIFDSLLRVRDYAFNIAENALNMGVPGFQTRD